MLNIILSVMAGVGICVVVLGPLVILEVRQARSDRAEILMVRRLMTREGGSDGE